MYKQGNARGTGEVRHGASSIHFHCPVPLSSSHIGHGVLGTDPPDPTLKSASPSPPPLTLQTLLFWKKQGFFPKKARVFLFAEPLKSLEKEGKTKEKARKIGKQKKQGNRKKQGLEGQGQESIRHRFYIDSTSVLQFGWHHSAKVAGVSLATLRARFASLTSWMQPFFYALHTRG